LFTKGSANAPNMTQAQMCHRLLSSLEDTRRATRFLLKQVTQQATQTNHRGQEMQSTITGLQKEVLHYKQANSSLKMQSEQTIVDLNNKLHCKNTVR
jgi:hypothetical protein